MRRAGAGVGVGVRMGVGVDWFHPPVVVGCQIDIFHFRLKTTKTARLFVLTAAGIPAAVNHSEIFSPCPFGLHLTWNLY